MSESSNQKTAVKAIYFSVAGNTLLSVIKWLTGYLGNSYALIADAIESTADIMSSLLVLVGIKYIHRPADENHPYGHGRLEPLVTFVVVAFLVVSAAIIAYESVSNIRTPHELPKVFTLYVLGPLIIWKEISFRLVMQKAKQANSSALKADAWHHRLLVWHTIPTTSFVAPDVVIGQTSLEVFQQIRGLRDIPTGGVQPQLDADGHVVGRVSGWRYVHAEHEAQAEVQRSRTLYQLIAENAADVVLLMDSDGQITWLSPSIERLSGWPAEALTGNQAWRLAHPDDADKIRAVVAEVLESSGRAHVEARLRTRHGDYRWWHIAMRRTSTDIDAALVAALRDVNDEVVARKRAESESAKRIALLNSMFDPHVVLEAVRDETGDIVDFIYTDANDAACEYNRTGREELVGASLMQLLPGHRGSDLFAAYCHTVDTGEPLVLDDYVYPNEILTEPRHYDIRAVKVADSLSYTWRDVTDRSLLGEQLAESEERFRLIATNTSDIIGVADTHGTLEWVSPSITRALGWDPADMKGHGVYELVHPNDMARVLQGQSEVADGREGSVRARVRDRDGKYHWSEVRAAPIISEQGKVLGITAAVSIIDERVAWEQTLRHQASHDPLTGLLNREEIFRRLDSMLGHPPRTGIRTFLAFLDLDNLKRTNDEFGHAAGDELLRTVAQRTRSLLRDGDQIARIGGDELLVILPGMQDTDAAVHLAGRLLETVSAPHTFGAHTLRPRMSIGVAEVHTGDDIERAVHKADTAMYRAKAAGGNRIALAD